jgi:hypothetical protein
MHVTALCSKPCHQKVNLIHCFKGERRDGSKGMKGIKDMKKEVKE